MWRTAGSRNLCGICGRGSTTHAAYTAKVPQPMRHIQPEFRNLCGIYGGVSAIYIMQQYILQKYTKFRLIYFGSVLNCQYRSIQAQVSFFQHSTIAALYKKRPRGVQRGAALCPFAVFSHFNVIYPLRGAAAYVAYTARFPQSMRLYGRSSAIHAAYTAGIPQSKRPFGRVLRSLCGYYFPIQNLENISLTRSSPSDSPRIRPRLSYASVRSIE